MSDIPRHKVFVSYYHYDDQFYKNSLLEQNGNNEIFDDYSVHEDEIDDTGMTDEQIRREIRDNYIKDATVLILLCGKNTKTRKHIDWEIHAAMYDSEPNPKMGILVVNLPSISDSMLSCGKDEEQVISPNINWVPASKDEDSIREKHGNLPERIITNLTRDDVRITIVNWNYIDGRKENLKYLIDNAFERRKTNNYDHSAPLRRRNST